MNTTSTYESETTITLSRTGAPHIRFSGILVGKRDNRKPDSNRWTIWKLYVTRSGKLVLHTEYRTIWEGEQSTSDVDVYRDPSTLCSEIRSQGLVPDDLNDLLISTYPDYWVETVD